MRLRPSLLLALALAACSRKAAEATPEGVVRELLDRFERVDGDPAEAKAAYELLAGSTRSNLIERARRASAATGRAVAPEEMIAPARFSLRFVPRQMHAQTSGQHAVVEVTGVDPEVDHAEIPCVVEDGRWRVEVDLPPPPAMERRPDGGP